MNNLLSYCGLVDARISASEKDLPVVSSLLNINNYSLVFVEIFNFYFDFIRG